VLSAFLAFCDRVIYLSYLSAPRAFNLSVLQDQECAAVLMWVSVTIIFLVPAVVITIQILSPPQASLAQEARVPSQRIAGQPLRNSKLEVG
jgi:cytochrome c oxidase assembly factor CtaG